MRSPSLVSAGQESSRLLTLRAVAGVRIELTQLCRVSPSRHPVCCLLSWVQPLGRVVSTWRGPLGFIVGARFPLERVTCHLWPCHREGGGVHQSGDRRTR